MKHNFNKKKLWFIIPLGIIGLGLLIYVTMLLWNNLMTTIFNLRLINYWEAAGLLVLSRLLFGFGGHMKGHHHESDRNHLREKWANMSPEEREEFKKHLKDHKLCGFENIENTKNANL